MLLYEDVITGDELFSDAFPLCVCSSSSRQLGSLCIRKEVDGIVFEVDCQMIVVKPGADVDIGQPSRFTKCDLVELNKRK
jgi:hypothetical protein